MTDCDYCGRDWQYSVYESDTEEICDRCWPKQEKRITARDKRWQEAGHDPTSDLCGCDLCAARADRGEFGRWP